MKDSTATGLAGCLVILFALGLRIAGIVGLIWLIVWTLRCTGVLG
jgi:hypothetical protein